MEQIDMLAIGDLVVDAFIKLKDAEVHCDENNEHCKLCMRYGDKIPYDYVEVCNAVGNSPNASVSAARLGLHSALISYVGNDRYGTDCIDELKKNKVNTMYVGMEQGKNTNYHYVLWYDVDRTILIKHENFEYTLAGVTPPKWIYLSSLGEKTLPFHSDISRFLEEYTDVKLAFQPGTFQMKFGTEALASIYRRTDMFFCNVEEAQLILKESSRELPVLLRKIRELGPKTIFITDGMNGAYVYDGTDIWFMPIYPHKPFERTGAGDAFASTVVSATILGKPLEEAMMWGPVNSMSVVLDVGAQKGLLSQEKLLEYLKKAPAEYKPRKIESGN